MSKASTIIEVPLDIQALLERLENPGSDKDNGDDDNTENGASKVLAKATNQEVAYTQQPLKFTFQMGKYQVTGPRESMH